MDIIRQTQIEADANNLKKAIIKQFAKFNVKIDITRHQVMEDRIVFLIKM